MPKGKGKKVESKKKTEHDEDEEEDVITKFTGKEKVPVALDVEEREDVVGPVDKMVADPLLDAEDVDSGTDSDDADLDEEEIDPFGDKWEG